MLKFNLWQVIIVRLAFWQTLLGNPTILWCLSSQAGSFAAALGMVVDPHSALLLSKQWLPLVSHFAKEAEWRR
jgi:hypothetical protein